MKKLNVIGRQVGRLRYQRGWTQEILAARLQLAGWTISRSGVSKIENGLVCRALRGKLRLGRVLVAKARPAHGFLGNNGRKNNRLFN